eukprot:3919154-Amphidinium_carterae.1
MKIPPRKPLRVNAQVTGGDLDRRKPTCLPEFALSDRTIAEHSGLKRIHSHVDNSKRAKHLSVIITKITSKIRTTTDDHHVINIFSHFHLPPHTTKRLDERNMQHVNSMPTAMREATRGCHTLTHRSLNQDASLPTVHIESNIQKNTSLVLPSKT